MFDRKTIRDTEIKGQIVLVRADYNVPLSEEGIVDDLRITASLPTLKYLLSHGAEKIVIMSHLGRPHGQVDAKLSLKVVAECLQQLLPEVPVQFVSEVAGPEVEMAVESLPTGGIVVLENLRFYPEEEDNSEDFMREIIDSTHASLFVQDGFAVLHRKCASTAAITQILPAVAGLLVEQEVSTLTQALKKPSRPLTVVVGGAKVEDKAPLIKSLSKVADQVLVGGKIAADGYQSEMDNVWVAKDFDTDAQGVRLDTGVQSTAKFVEFLQSAQTVIWNGVLGKVEDQAYTTASTIIARCLGEREDVQTIVCGGDTTAFVRQVQKEHPELHYGLISTGGGAALELLSGKKLPGLVVLPKQDKKSHKNS